VRFDKSVTGRVRKDPWIWNVDGRSHGGPSPSHEYTGTKKDETYIVAGSAYKFQKGYFPEMTVEKIIQPRSARRSRYIRNRDDELIVDTSGNLSGLDDANGNEGTPIEDTATTVGRESENGYHSQ
jgi:hypothetical protein